MSPLLLYVLGFAGLGGVYALDRLANTVVRPPIRRPDRSVAELGLAHEPFRITSGAHQLGAWLVHAAGDGGAHRAVADGAGRVGADGALRAGAEGADNAGAGALSQAGANAVSQARADAVSHAGADAVSQAGAGAASQGGAGAAPSSDASGRPVVLLAHGWGASHGIMLRLAGPLARMGHDVVLFDVRGHGTNAAVPFVTVRCFREDLVAAVAWVRARFPARPLVVVGHSFGGAAAVLAAAEGAPVDGLVLVATPSDVLRTTAEFLTSRGLPGPFMVTALRPFWWRRVRGSFGPLTASRRIGELEQPLLVIQPEHDQRVARWHAERLSAAAGVDYHLVPGREHTDVLEAPMTLELIRSFLERMSAAAAGSS